MIVVDASVAVKWFVAEVGDGAARALLQHGEMLIAPDFVLLETLNVLRRKLKRGEIGSPQLHQAAKVLEGYFDQLVPATALVERAIDLAITLDHPVYDCAYLACAIQQSATLATADEAFFRKAGPAGFGAHVTLLS